jgi:hypothetical protein
MDLLSGGDGRRAAFSHYCSENNHFTGKAYRNKPGLASICADRKKLGRAGRGSVEKEATFSTLF